MDTTMSATTTDLTPNIRQSEALSLDRRREIGIAAIATITNILLELVRADTNGVTEVLPTIVEVRFAGQTCLNMADTDGLRTGDNYYELIRRIVQGAKNIGLIESTEPTFPFWNVFKIGHLYEGAVEQLATWTFDDSVFHIANEYRCSKAYSAKYDAERALWLERQAAKERERAAKQRFTTARREAAKKATKVPAV